MQRDQREVGLYHCKVVLHCTVECVALCCWRNRYLDISPALGSAFQPLPNHTKPLLVLSSVPQVPFQQYLFHSTCSNKLYTPISTIFLSIACLVSHFCNNPSLFYSLSEITGSLSVLTKSQTLSLTFHIIFVLVGALFMRRISLPNSHLSISLFPLCLEASHEFVQHHILINHDFYMKLLFSTILICFPLLFLFSLFWIQINVPIPDSPSHIPCELELKGATNPREVSESGNEEVGAYCKLCSYTICVDPTPPIQYVACSDFLP